MRRLGSAFLFTFLLLGLTGCASTVSTALEWLGYGPHKAELRSLRVISTADANQNKAKQSNATRLDIVAVYDSAAIAQLPKTAPEWFARKQGLLDGMQAAFEVVSLELPPDTLVSEVELPRQVQDALALMAYADYFAEKGQNGIDLSQSKAAELRLNAQAVQLVNIK